MTRATRFCAALLCLLCPIVTLAEDSGLKRLTLRQDGLGWEAVGRLDLPNGFCTGTLIETDLVLTAAHCLVSPRTGQRIDPRKIVFRAGFRDGVSVAERPGSRAVLHPDYRFDDEDGLHQLVSDVALLQLGEPVPAAHAAPFQAARDVRSGQQVSLVSYARDRDAAQSWQKTCAVSRAGRGAVVVTCDASFGSSGAPVFDTSSGRPRIVALISRGDQRGANEAYGMQISRPLSEVRAALREGRGVWPEATFEAHRIGRPGEANGDRDDIGARFVRP